MIKSKRNPQLLVEAELLVEHAQNTPLDKKVLVKTTASTLERIAYQHVLIGFKVGCFIGFCLCMFAYSVFHWIFPQ